MTTKQQFDTTAARAQLKDAQYRQSMYGEPMSSIIAIAYVALAELDRRDAEEVKRQARDDAAIRELRAELSDGDYWMKRSTEFYIELGGCPVCFATDELGHTANCLWGKDEAENKTLRNEIADAKALAYNMLPDRTLDDQKDTLDEQLSLVREWIGRCIRSAATERALREQAAEAGKEAGHAT